MQPGSPEGVLAAIAQSGNAMTQGWMRLLSSPPQLERNSALQTEYLEQQLAEIQAIARKKGLIFVPFWDLLVSFFVPWWDHGHAKPDMLLPRKQKRE